MRKTEIGHIDDIRMAKPAGGTRLAAKTLDEFGPLHKLRRDDLYRHRTLGSEMGGKIDRSHTAAPEFAFDLVFVVERLPYIISKIHIFEPSVLKVITLPLLRQMRLNGLK